MSTCSRYFFSTSDSRIQVMSADQNVYMYHNEILIKNIATQSNQMHVCQKEVTGDSANRYRKRGIQNHAKHIL